MKTGREEQQLVNPFALSHVVCIDPHRIIQLNKDLT